MQYCIICDQILHNLYKRWFEHIENINQSEKSSFAALRNCIMRYAQ